LIDRAVRSPEVNRLAIAVLEAGKAREHDATSAAKTIYNWVRANFRFVPDVIGYDAEFRPQGYETLRPVEEILRAGGGDCDDINGILLPSLLSSVGIPVRLVTVASDSSTPGVFSHIYPEAYLAGQWVAVDAARPGARFGREPEYYSLKRIWGVEGGYVDLLPGEEYSAMDSEVAQLVGLNGLGQDDGDGGIDWTAVSQVAEQALKSTPTIIAAARAPGAALPMVAMSAGAAAASMNPSYAVPAASISGISPGTIFMGIAVLAGFFLLAKR
jgi:transglutaminase-like putative cysteine protease